MKEVWEFVCLNCGNRCDASALGLGNKYHNRCAKCGGCLWLDKDLWKAEVRYQYSRPGAFIHELWLVGCIDRRHYDGNLSEFVLSVWREYKNNLTVEQIATLLEQKPSDIRKALEIIGIT